MNTTKKHLIVFGSLLFLLSTVFAEDIPDVEPVEEGRLRISQIPAPSLSPRPFDEEEEPEGPEEDFWNWYDMDVVTPIKDQGETQACSAYTLSSQFESAMILKDNLPRSEADIAEEYLVDRTGTAGGGNAMTLVSYLARYGTVMTEDYLAGDEPYPVANRLTRWEILSLNYFIEPHELKFDVRDEGPLYTDVYFGEPGSDDRAFIRAYNGRNALESFIIIEEEPTENPVIYDQVTHSVLLVGWDDDYIPPPPSPENNPGGNIEVDLESGISVFIVKNSWGQEWGDRGYAYIRPGHLNLGHYTSMVTGWRKPHLEERVIAYDDGYNMSLGYSGQSHALGLIQYPMDNSEQSTVYVHGFDIWVPDAASVEFMLFDGFNESKQQIIYDSYLGGRGFDAPSPGFYSVDLPSPIRVSTTTPNGEGQNNVYLRYKVTVQEGNVKPLLSYQTDSSERIYTSFVSRDGDSWFCINQDFYMYQFGDLAVRLRYAPVRTGIDIGAWEMYQ